MGLLGPRELLLELARLIDRLAGTQVVQLEELANLDLALRSLPVRGGRALGPFDRLFPRLDLDQPVAGDQLLGLGERAVDHGALPSGEPHARALRAGLEP